MACETAVVASDVGGIPEVVADGETGVLVHYDQFDPSSFEVDFAKEVNRVVADSELARQLGVAGRRRAIKDFAWDSIAVSTIDVYRSVIR
jgi:starch synthase